MRLLAVVRVEDADEGRQPRRGDRELAQDSRLLVPGQHVTARSGRDGRGRAASSLLRHSESGSQFCGRYAAPKLVLAAG